MRTLGIDPSLTCTGWAVVEDGKVIESGTIKVPTRRNKQLICFRSRSFDIAEQILDTISSFHYGWEPFKKYKSETGNHFDFVAVETPYLGKSMQGYGKLSFLQGAITCHLSRYFSIELLAGRLKWYSPSEVKQAVTSNGNASKEQVLKMVQLQSGYKGKQFDESDAIAVALTCEREIQSQRS